MQLLYSALGAASLCYVIVRICQSYWKKRGILHDKPKFLWGNVKGVGQKRHFATALLDVYERLKGQAPFVGYYVLLKPMVLILDLDLIYNILTKDAEYFNTCDTSLPGSRLQLDNKEWKTMCSHAKPVFNGAEVRKSQVRIVRTIEHFCHRLDAQFTGTSKEVDVYQFAKSLHMDIFAGLAFGQWSKDDLTKFRTVTQQHLDNFSLIRAYICLHFPFVARYVVGSSPEAIDIVYYEYIVSQELRNRRRQPISSPEVDFLQMLVESLPPADGYDRLYHQRIAAQACAYLFVGLETCSPTLSFCLYELALHPEIQRKAYEEVNNQINVDRIKLEYLKQIIYETLRKYSPYPLLLRETVRDYEVDDSVFLLQTGNQLIIPISAIHHDPQLYPEPDRFDPERFHPKNMADRHRAAFLPFGFGPQRCIARDHVEQQLITTLAALLLRYEFSPSANTPVPLHYDTKKIVLTPKCSELKLNVRQRNKWSEQYSNLLTLV